jgi:hypothetical protein
MILQAIRRAHDRYRLHDAGRDVGWVGGNAFGFHRFAGVHEAIDAARAAHATIGPWLLRQRRLPGDGARALKLGTDTDDQVVWLTAGDVRIGRVDRCACTKPAGEDADYAYELWLPAGLGTPLVLSAARQVYSAAVRRASLATATAGAAIWPIVRSEEPEQWFASSG